MSKHAEKVNQKIARLMREHGITENRKGGYTYYYDKGEHTATVFTKRAQSAANLPWTAETDNWLGYFHSLPEAQLAAVEALATE